MDVIAHILHHLKYRLLTLLKDFGYNIKASDFDWVITVPAIWKSKGKRMMREAGYMVSSKQKFANSYAYIKPNIGAGQGKVTVGNVYNRILLLSTPCY